MYVERTSTFLNNIFDYVWNVYLAIGKILYVKCIFKYYLSVL